MCIYSVKSFKVKKKEKKFYSLHNLAGRQTNPNMHERAGKKR